MLMHYEFAPRIALQVLPNHNKQGSLLHADKGPVSMLVDSHLA